MQLPLEKTTYAENIYWVYGLVLGKSIKKNAAEAIKELQHSHEKITQKKVAKVAGLSEPTVKNYWSENKSLVKEINQSIVSDSMLFENN